MDRALRLGGIFRILILSVTVIAGFLLTAVDLEARGARAPRVTDRWDVSLRTVTLHSISVSPLVEGVDIISAVVVDPGFEDLAYADVINAGEFRPDFRIYSVMLEDNGWRFDDGAYRVTVAVCTYRTRRVYATVNPEVCADRSSLLKAVNAAGSIYRVDKLNE